jgi:histidinol phosphatase-like PHP family hydrolase
MWTELSPLFSVGMQPDVPRKVISMVDDRESGFKFALSEMDNMDLGRRREFHTHTFFSDGALSCAEQLRYGVVRGLDAMALTDHVDFANVEHVVNNQLRMKEEWDGKMRMLVGVELTHTRPTKIAKLAALAKSLGADIVVMHGETPVEPVEPGTNAAAAACKDVDILAHPGNLTLGEAEAAVKNGVFIELTSRGGHNRFNGHVARMASEAGAELLVNSDMHAPGDLITQEEAYAVALGSGLPQKDALAVVRDNPLKFLKRLK